MEYQTAHLLLAQQESSPYMAQLPLKLCPLRHYTQLQNSSESHMPRCPVLWTHSAL